MSHQQGTQIGMIKIKATRYEKMGFCEFSDGEEREKGGSQYVRRGHVGSCKARGQTCWSTVSQRPGHKDKVRTEY